MGIIFFNIFKSFIHRQKYFSRFKLKFKLILKKDRKLQDRQVLNVHIYKKIIYQLLKFGLKCNLLKF